MRRRGYANQRLFKWPAPLALTLLGLMAALGLMALKSLDVIEPRAIEEVLLRLDFPNLLLHGLLGLTLFAGGLFVDASALRQWWKPVAWLAVVGVAVSAMVVAGLLWAASNYFALGLSPIWCLLFGALISPTDPLAALAIVKKARAPKDMEIKLVGESLFNDGSAVVLFLVLLGVLTTGEVDAGTLAWEAFLSPIGGAGLGALPRAQPSLDPAGLSGSATREGSGR